MKNYRFALITVLASMISSFIFLSSFISCQEAKKEDPGPVLEAYHLRMAGEVDSALSMLEKIIQEDPENVLAYYELARTQEHIADGSQELMMEYFKEASDNIDKALTLEPDNIALLDMKAEQQSLALYIKLEEGAEDVSTELKILEGTCQKILTIDPNFYPVKLRMVELYSWLPAEMGGDKQKAERYAQELEQQDLVYGAKAREIMMPEDADYVAYWSGLRDQNPDNVEIIEALGKVYLMTNNIDDARKCFDSAMVLNPEKKVLYLDIGRYYMIQAMQGIMPVDTAVPLIMAEFDKFLSSYPDACNRIKAWVKGQQAMLNYRTGNELAGEALLAEAKALDPYFAKFFMPPSQGMCGPPNELSKDFGYLSRPF